MKRGTAPNAVPVGSANAPHARRMWPPSGSCAACDGHALRCWLVAVCEPNRSSPQRPPERARRAQAPIRSLRLRHPTRCHAAPAPATESAPSVRCASLSTCCPARSDSHRHGRCGYRRFTRSIRPPVPRSGVAPLRSPQSLPVPAPPCQGPRVGGLGSAPGRTQSRRPPGFTGTSQRARPSLKEPHVRVIPLPRILCQVESSASHSDADRR